MSQAEQGALSGIKIADFSRVLAGPYATMLLGDLGADVVKVERTGFGDEARTWGPPFDAKGRATYFQSVNRNKSGLFLDLTKESDRAKARELILSSDVVVENFGVGGMAKFGLDYESISKESPKIIYCSITGFGTSEVAAQLPGYDALVQGMSGLMSITGDKESGPSKVGVALIDVIAGLHATTGILAALRARDQFGVGQQVEINLLSSALSAMVNQSGAYVGAGVIPGLLGNSHPSIVPYGVFQAKDRPFIIAAGNDHQFAALCEILNMKVDQKFATNKSRVENRSELERTLNSLLGQKNVAEWIELLRAKKIPAGPINSIAEALDFAREIGLDVIVDIDGAKSVANPISLSKTEASYRLPPPSM